MFCATDQHLLSSLYRKARFRIFWVKILVRVTLFTLVFLANAALFLPFALLRCTPPVVLRSFFHRTYMRILGISLRVRGSALAQAHVLYVSNHVSYIDIPSLMSLTGARFVSRGDLASIPLFGWLMKSYGTVFIHRIRHKVQKDVVLLQYLLDKGNAMLLFGEGTTSDGRNVLPMKSSLFAALESANSQSLSLQPISLRYSMLDSMPMGTYWEPLCAWHGKVPFLPHLWGVLSLHRIMIDIYVHPPTPVARIKHGRKGMTRFCEDTIREGCALLRYGVQEENLAPLLSPKPHISSRTP